MTTATTTAKAKKAAPRAVTAAELAASAADAFTFTAADGTTHTLPAPAKLTGREVRDAVMDGEVGMMRSMYVRLERATSTPEHRAAVDALYDLDDDKSLIILRNWAAHHNGGASLGE